MDQSNLFTINDVASKCRSKLELYNLLTSEGGMYLPPIQDATQQYIRQLMMGKKNYVKSEDIKVIKVPHYNGLTVAKILNFARNKGDIQSYLPDYKYSKEPNREWLCNLINTLIPKEFQEYVALKVSERKHEIIHTQNLSISAKSEFIKIFKNSRAISKQKGRSHFLIREVKETKDKKTIHMLEEETKESNKKAKLLEDKLAELREKIADLERDQILASED